MLGARAVGGACSQRSHVALQALDGFEPDEADCRELAKHRYLQKQRPGLGGEPSYQSIRPACGLGARHLCGSSLCRIAAAAME